MHAASSAGAPYQPNPQFGQQGSSDAVPMMYMFVAQVNPDVSLPLQSNHMPAMIPANNTFVDSPAPPATHIESDVSDSQCPCLQAIWSGGVDSMPVEQGTRKTHRRRGR